MKTEITSSLIELLLSLVIAILTVYLTKIALMKFYLKKTNDNQKLYKNLSFMILLSGNIFAVSYIVFGIMEPMSSTIKLLSHNYESNFEYIINLAKYFFIFLFLGLTFGGLIIYSTYQLFTVLTKELDEFREVSEGNVGVGILVAVLSIVIALFTKTPFLNFVESLIPYPELPGIL